jgi:hypothetical protein
VTLLLAVVVTAVPLLAQGPAFQSTSLPRQVRFEGRAETVGEIFLLVTNPGSTILAGSSINIIYQAAVTGNAGGNSVTCRLAGAATTGCGGAANITVTASGSQLTINFVANMAFPNAGDGITINQVRADINAAGTGTTQFTATLSGVSASPVTNPITFTQPVLTVGSVVNPSTTQGFPTTPPTGLTCAGATSLAFSLTLKETFPAAFTSATQETAFTPNIAITTNNGSQIEIIFTNVPTGVVLTPGLPTWGVAGPVLNTPAAQTGANANLTFVYTFQAGGDPLLATVETATFPFTATFTGGNPLASGGVTGAISARLRLAPVSTTSTTMPRFADNNTTGGAAFNINDCVTNLLFPFVTNQVGFDTSFAIANTTSDDLAFTPTGQALPGGTASSQAGTCDLTLYPTDLTAASPAPGTAVKFTTSSIASGQTYANSQSAITSFAGQSGYVIAVCRFLNAHAFAIITNGFGGTTTISHGYLALIIPAPLARVAPIGESLSN